MSVQDIELLNYAKSKSNPSNSELELRCIVSRAYYAAYHRANNFHLSLSTSGVSPPQSTGVHSKLIHQLRNPGIPRTDPDFLKSIAMGYILQGLKPLRKKADYDLDEFVTPNDALTSINQSQLLINK